MVTCTSCAAENSATNKFCSDCGVALSPGEAATVAPDVANNAVEAKVHSSRSSSAHHGRFLPGTKVANRYRIVSLVGKGGMGEVYRADDLKLGHTVALKFLPRSLSKDARRLEYFHSEVRLTRQISHPNVCRVYDIGEFDALHYLSMEYVDGEDLRVLLRRIGHLPSDKGVEIARQLCAGLTAAHNQRVLHRDLKPANIMLDGRGQIRITDFGLARLAEEETAAEVAGTPAYMAPEQLASGETSIQSDLYSLGLILHELFTGEAVHKSNSVPELLEKHRDSNVSNPSELVKDMDPAVERVILRCLQKEPSQRPKSVQEVAAALPGGDPLMAAIAAGETPSPELVAASGSTGRIPLAAGLALLVAVVLGLVANAWNQSKVAIPGAIELSKAPQELAGIARELTKQLDSVQSEQHQDEAFGFTVDSDYMSNLRNVPLETRWQRLLSDRPGPAVFWYRKSPDWLTPRFIDSQEGRGWSHGEIEFSDPPHVVPGMVRLSLDPDGHLLAMSIVSAATVSDPDPTEERTWGEILSQVSPNLAAFAASQNERVSEVTPRWTPPVATDQLAAWQGTGLYPDWDDSQIRLEAGTWQGLLVYIRVVRPTDQTKLRQPDEIGVKVANVMWFVALIGSVVLGIRNLLARRADTKGAARIATFVVALSLLRWFFSASHRPSLLHEHDIAIFALALAIQSAVRYWFYYIALEPYLRKLWPESLISASRVLAGRAFDPLVGRHLLIGIAVSCGWAIVNWILITLSQSLGLHPQSLPQQIPFASLIDSKSTVGSILFCLQNAIYIGLLLSTFMLIFRLVLRNKHVANVGVFLCVMLILTVSSTTFVEWVATAVGVAAALTVWTRFGVFPYMAFVFSNVLLRSIAFTTDHTVWYFHSGVMTAVLIAGIALYGFFTSVGPGIWSDPLEARTD